jgi:hypothetical protein
MKVESFVVHYFDEVKGKPGAFPGAAPKKFKTSNLVVHFIFQAPESSSLTTRMVTLLPVMNRQD